MVNVIMLSVVMLNAVAPFHAKAKHASLFLWSVNAEVKQL
jgi:hypothetical protein